LPSALSWKEPARVIGRLARGQLHLEPPATLHRDVERVAGRRGAALLHDAVDRGGLDAEAELDARRHDGVGVRRRGAGAALVLVEQVLELGALTLERRRVHVGDVVRDRLHVELLSQHAGRRDTE
jgi:hypothetical protein